MPQMSPLSWLMTLTLSLIMIFTVMNHMKMFPLVKESSLKTSKKEKPMKW